ncbi:MAG: type II toxin-antitoxin system HicA family toxin [Elusimicrobia bacterium]|nr:type II toxin-antitoxin system HicA family toxin [Elusimicrobiota bacterium]
MKLPSLLSQRIIRVLLKAGFEYAPKRGKGSHRAFVKCDDGKFRLVIVPQGRDIPRGTLMAIIGQSGLTRDEFVKLL